MNTDKIVQLMLNIYNFLITILLWIGLLISIPYNGIMYFNYNEFGEMWLEFWLLPISALFILGFGIYYYKKEEKK